MKKKKKNSDLKAHNFTESKMHFQNSIVKNHNPPVYTLEKPAVSGDINQLP
jgi:hypothetical protein